MTEAIKVGGEFLVNTQTAGGQHTPTMTSLANGGFVVAWQDGGGGGGSGSGTLGDTMGTSLKAQVYDADGARVGSEFLVNTQTASDQLSPTITGLANGGFAVSWYDFSGTLGDASGTSIKAQLFDASGTKAGAEFLVNTQTAQLQLDPAIAGLADGGFVVAWFDYSGTLGDASQSAIKAQRFDASGDKVGDEFLVNTQTSQFQLYPTVTGLASGGFAIAWYDNSGTLGDASGASVKLQLFDSDGDRVGTEVLVNSQTANDQYSPTITGLTNGGFVVSWQDASGTLGDASGVSIKAQLFDSGGAKVGDEFLVNTQTALGQELPTIAGLADGRFVVSWYDTSGVLTDGSGANIKAQLFDADGSKVGDEVLVNTQTANNQFGPTVTDLAEGGFAVAWHDFSRTLGDNSGTSIKAQIFDVVESVLFSSRADRFNFNVLTQDAAMLVDDQAAADADLLYQSLRGDDIIYLPTLANAQLTPAVQWDFAHAFDAGAGNDIVTGRDGDDHILGGRGADVIGGGAGNDRLEGGADGDGLSGGSGDDILIGGAGNDRLAGGRQMDVLTGDAGADVFAFETIYDSRHGVAEGPSRADLIMDFNRAEGDRIDLSQIDASILLAEDQAFILIGRNLYSGTAGELRWFLSADRTQTIIQGDVDGDLQSDFSITLATRINLVTADFLL